MLKARLQLSFIVRMYFFQGMVVLLNPVCILLSGMHHVYKSSSEVRVAVFETMTSKTLASLRRLKIVEIVWTFIFEAAGRNAERCISYNHQFHIVLRRNSK